MRLAVCSFFLAVFILFAVAPDNTGPPTLSHGKNTYGLCNTISISNTIDIDGLFRLAPFDSRNDNFAAGVCDTALGNFIAPQPTTLIGHASVFSVSAGGVAA